MALDAFTRDQDFSTSLEGPTEEEIKAKEAAEREEARACSSCSLRKELRTAWMLAMSRKTTLAM